MSQDWIRELAEDTARVVDLVHIDFGLREIEKAIREAVDRIVAGTHLQIDFLMSPAYVAQAGVSFGDDILLHDTILTAQKSYADQVQTAVHVVVEMDREECAKVAEGFCDPPSELIAEAIRARGNP